MGVLGGTSGAIDDLLASSASTLTVGSGAASGTFSATIQNSSGTISLAKVGTGSVLLAGTNSYSGATAVSGGILQFVQPAALYNSATGSWTAANISVASSATLAVNVDTNGGFTPSQAGTLFANLSGSNSGLLAGAFFGIDTTNATGPVVFSTLLQDSAAGPVGFTKLGTGVLKVTNASNSYTGPTTVVNGQLMLFGANTNSTAPGLVTVSNSTSGGLSILSLLNHNALGSSGADGSMAPVSLNATGGGTSILEIGATLGLDPNYPSFTSDFSYVLVPAGQAPGAGQISLGGDASGAVGFSASSSNFAPRVVALYSTASPTTLQTLQFGVYLPGNLVLGSSDADTALVLQNPIDLNSNVAGSSVQFSSIHGTASPLPEGEYAGAISNSGSAAVNVTFAGSGGLLFASSANSFNAASLQLAGGGLFISSADYANGQTGPLGSGTSALVIGVTSGTSATASGANLAFLTDGPNSKIIGSNPSTLFSDRNIIVNAVPGNGSVVLGGFSDDYTAMNGSVQLNGPATFYAAQSGRVDFTGPISGSGAVQIGGTALVEGAGPAGIQLGSNGTIAFTVANSYSGSTTVASGRLLVNGSLYASSSSSAASTVTVSAGTLGGTGTIYGAVTMGANTMLEAGMAAGSPLTLAGGLTAPYSYANGSNVIFKFDSLGTAGNPGLVVNNGLNNVGLTGGQNPNTQEFLITGAISGANTYALMETDSSGSARLGARRQHRHLRAEPVASQPGRGWSANQSRQPGRIGPRGDWAVLGCLDRAAWQRLERLGQFRPVGRN